MPLTVSVPPSPFIVSVPAPLIVRSRLSEPLVLVAVKLDGENVPDVCVSVPPA